MVEAERHRRARANAAPDPQNGNGPRAMADASLQQKTCSACGNSKPIDAFSLSPLYADGRRGQCIECRRRYNRQWNRTDAGRAAARRCMTPKKRRAKKLWHKYKITEIEFDQMLERQNGKCAICETTAPGGKHDRFVVDHCHDRQKIRGLLCFRCNTVLGQIGDDSVGIMKFVRYLRSDM